MFHSAKIQYVPVYGWADEVSIYLQTWVHNKCNMSTDWTWFTFLKRNFISLLNFYNYSKMNITILLIKEPYYCIARHGTLVRVVERPWAYYYTSYSLWSKVYNVLWLALDPMVILWPAHHAWMGVTIMALLVAWATRGRTQSGC
jgi:hypothetical protein